MELSIFDSFDAELVKMVSGDLRAWERLDWLQRNTSRSPASEGTGEELWTPPVM